MCPAASLTLIVNRPFLQVYPERLLTTHFTPFPATQRAPETRLAVSATLLPKAEFLVPTLADSIVHPLEARLDAAIRISAMPSKRVRQALLSG